MPDKRYVLITAARNEEACIREPLQSIVKQTQPPALWLIISDGTTDRTDEFVREYAGRYDFIRLLRLDNAGARSFSSKAFALNAGYDHVRHLKFDFLGFLDADISLPVHYYEELMTRFERQPRLGLAGGAIVEHDGGRWELRPGDSLLEVGGQMQLFRRQCYDDIGQFAPLQWGGEDTVANFMARRKGWQVSVFRDLHVRHHRRTGTAGASVYRARFRNGMCDYHMGYHPLFEFAKCVRRVLEPPYAAGSLLRLSGYIWSALTWRQPSMPNDFVRYLRCCQKQKLLRAREDA